MRFAAAMAWPETWLVAPHCNIPPR
jgi:hypothetical protein